MDINTIYCRHLLCNDNLKKHLTNCKHKYYYIDPHYILHIEDTIHYNALISNNYKKYEEYIKTTLQKEHSVDIFLNLKNNFDVIKMAKIKVQYNYEKNKYIIQDGVHRLSVLLHKNLINNNIPIKYLDIKQNNCFYFVIYEHGINYCDAICNEIEKSKIRIDRKIHLDLPTSKFKDFIYDIYPDTNKNHIVAKNKYIIDFSSKRKSIRAVILLVSIDKWTHMENKCKEIELIKRKIRNLYNPKFQDINKQIHPLNKGISHNHVIHSIDFPNEFMTIYSVVNKYSRYILI